MDIYFAPQLNGMIDFFCFILPLTLAAIAIIAAKIGYEIARHKGYSKWKGALLGFGLVALGAVIYYWPMLF